ncbi:MAG TPA: hypothetical protein VFS43_47740 [Polyangiaceae bacterium]|nr:hypothetical protein [Polyangiaceae bacterium]
MLTSEPPDRGRPLWSSDKGRALYRRAAPGVLVFTFEGDLSSACADSTAAVLMREVGLVVPWPGQFLDLEQVNSCSPGFRRRLVQWYRDKGPWLGELHLLFRPEASLVAMMASMLDLAVPGGVRLAADRQAFEGELRRACEAATDPGAGSGRRSGAPGSMWPEPYADTDLIKVYWLPGERAGYGVWRGLPTPSATREALELAEGLLRERGSARWVSNTEEALVSPPETQAVIVSWLQQMRWRYGLRAWADVPPASAVARLVVKNLGVESVQCGVHFAQFASLDEARAWVATK